MLMNRLVLALIPARKGSKGLPGKNRALLLGRPLLDYTLDAAIGARSIDETWLSSDDDEILSLGARRGVRTLRRPDSFASDTASAMDVVDHWLSVLPDHIKAQDPLLVYLQPTSPLRTAGHIEQSLTLLEASKASCLLSVVEMDKSPYKAFKADENGRLQSLFDERLSNQRRQDLPKVYLPNGAIYIFGLSDYLNRGGFPSNGSLSFEMSRDDSTDIDDQSDMDKVQRILEKRHG